MLVERKERGTANLMGKYFSIRRGPPVKGSPMNFLGSEA